MRVLFARCQTRYTGRMDAELELGDRLILVKDDGAVVVHATKGLKEKNWMPAGSVCTEIPGRLLDFQHVARAERLEIFIEEVFSDTEHIAQLDGRLIKLGAEREISNALSTRLDVMGHPPLTLVRREYPTGAGPIDILATDPEGNPVAIEVKRARVSNLEVAYQLIRYLDALVVMIEWDGTTPRGIIAAPAMSRDFTAFAATKGLLCVRLDIDDLLDPQPVHTDEPFIPVEDPKALSGDAQAILDLLTQDD